VENKFVLLVEDNADDEMLAVRAFKKSNIKRELVVVRDGAEALDFIFCTGKYSDRNIKDQPEFILLDLKLPKLDGHQVLERIRQNNLTKYLPVIILTSSQEEHDLQKSYSKGVNSYVLKPLDANDFLELIRNVGQYWLDLNKTPHINQLGV
jgi:CheY-like chemotaxis protein